MLYGKYVGGGRNHVYMNISVKAHLLSRIT